MRDPSSPDETLGCQISPIHSIELHYLVLRRVVFGWKDMVEGQSCFYCNSQQCLYRGGEGVYFFVPTPSYFNKAAKGLIVPGVGRKGG